MRHKKAGKQLSRNSSHRKAMLRNIVTSLFKYEQIETTDAKAKSLRPIAEKMITLAKRGDLHARRQALSYMQDKSVTHKLFDELKDQFLDRQGGYLRIIKKGVRKGDGAPISIVQLISEDEKTGKKKSKKRKKSKVTTVSMPEEKISQEKEENISDSSEVTAEVAEEGETNVDEGQPESSSDTTESEENVSGEEKKEDI